MEKMVMINAFGVDINNLLTAVAEKKIGIGDATTLLQSGCRIDDFCKDKNGVWWAWDNSLDEWVVLQEFIDEWSAEMGRIFVGGKRGCSRVYGTRKQGISR